MTGFLSCPFIYTNVVPVTFVGADWLRPQAPFGRHYLLSTEQIARSYFTGGASTAGEAIGLLLALTKAS